MSIRCAGIECLCEVQVHYFYRDHEHFSALELTSIHYSEELQVLLPFVRRNDLKSWYWQLHLFQCNFQRILYGAQDSIGLNGITNFTVCLYQRQSAKIHVSSLFNFESIRGLIFILSVSLMTMKCQLRSMLSIKHKQNAQFFCTLTKTDHIFFCSDIPNDARWWWSLLEGASCCCFLLFKYPLSTIRHP